MPQSDYKSRFYVTPESLLDVSEIVFVESSDKDHWAMYRNGQQIFFNDQQTARDIAAYVVEYEQWSQGQWASYTTVPTLVDPAKIVTVTESTDGLSLSDEMPVEDKTPR